MNDARDRALLKQRAELLAQPAERARKEQPTYTIFQQGGKKHALEKRYVYEVARVLPPTPLPNSPAPWLGVTSLHGELLALADLSCLLGDEARERAAEAPQGEARRLALVVGRERREFGLVIDAVLGLSGLAEELAHTCDTEASSSRLIVGATADGTCVLDGEALLADDRLFMAHSTYET